MSVYVLLNSSKELRKRDGYFATSTVNSDILERILFLRLTNSDKSLFYELKL